MQGEEYICTTIFPQGSIYRIIGMNNISTPLPKTSGYHTVDRSVIFKRKNMKRRREKGRNGTKTKRKDQNEN
jgi:hypothetical protein